MSKIKFLKHFCIKVLFCNHYFSPLNTFMRKGKDPDPDPYWGQTGTDADPEGPKHWSSLPILWVRSVGGKDQATQCCDQDPGSGAFWTPGSGMGEKLRSGMNILDHIFESLETIFWFKILKFFYEDADPGNFLTLDPGWQNSDPG
jgi:hypothetical protein